MIQHILLAPLDGITRAVYRRVWMRHFGGVDTGIIPFFSPTPQHIMTQRDRREIDVENSLAFGLIPQIMTRRAEDFLWGASAVAEMGFQEVNLNLGCPSGTVTAKGKGSGFLADTDALSAFFDRVFSEITQPVSVKTRLGIHQPEEFQKLLEIYNHYPITLLTIHPRIKQQGYKGPVDGNMFAWAIQNSQNPVCYSGDIQTVKDVRELEARFPQLENLMLGRGIIADPALPRKLRGGSPASRKELQGFTKDLYAEYQEFYGQVFTAAQRMKEIWYYQMHLFENSAKLAKELRRSRGPGEYERIEAQVYQELPLRTDTEGVFV